MVSRILALLVWAAVAASAAYWGLRWFSSPIAVPPGTSAVALNTAPRGDMLRLFKAPKALEDAAVAEAPSALQTRLRLLGVVAPRRGQVGVALLSVDGRPARAYVLGSTVDGDQVVQTITQQGVQIGPAGGRASVNLSLPLLPPPATGTLPGLSATSFGAPTAMASAGYNAPPPAAYGQTANPSYVTPEQNAGEEAAMNLPPRMPVRGRRPPGETPPANGVPGNED